MEIGRVRDKSLTQAAKKAIYDYIKLLDISRSNKLPNEDELAESLGVSRITVRSALNELASEGIVFRKQGRGTFVNKEALQMKVSFAPARDLRDVITESGYNVGVKIIRYEVKGASEYDANKLQIATGDKILYIEKIFYANEKPAMLCIDRIANGYFREPITENELEQPIYEYITHTTGKKIAWDKVEISTTTREKNKLLDKYFDMENSKSFLNCEIINFDNTDTPIILINEFSDTNIIRYNLIRQKH